MKVLLWVVYVIDVNIWKASVKLLQYKHEYFADHIIVWQDSLDFLHDFPVKLLFIVRIQLNSIDIYIYVYVFILGLNMSKKPSASETNLMTVNRGKMLPAKEGNYINFKFKLILFFLTF